jgi:hypothetical protein
MARRSHSHSARGGYSGNNAEIYVVAADGTGLTPLTFNTVDDEDPAWSPDGKKIVFTSNLGDPDPAGCVQRQNCLFDLHVMNSDGSNLAQLTGGRIDLRELDPSWEPNGNRIAYYCEQNIVPFSKGICLVNSDGTRIRYLGSGRYPNWSPDGSKIAFTDYSANGKIQTYTMNPDGTGRTLVPSREQLIVIEPAWSPDRAKIADAYQGCGTPSGGCNPLVLETRNVDGTGGLDLTSGLQDNSQPDWQPIPITGYARPKGATPGLTSLTIAFKPCASPNRAHGEPLSGGSCNPPAQASDYLTVGTLDANQEQANSTGSVRYDVKIGNPSTPADEADVKLTFSITDVRLKSDLSDYAGELSVNAQRRITDKDNTPAPNGGSGAATVQDMPFAFTVPCAVTSSDTTIGSLCSLDTTADTLVPGSVKEGMRSIWELSQVQSTTAARTETPTPLPTTRSSWTRGSSCPNCACAARSKWVAGGQGSGLAEQNGVLVGVANRGGRIVQHFEALAKGVPDKLLRMERRAEVASRQL